MRISDESSDVCSSDLRKTLGDAAEEVQEGAVEKGIALAERRDVAARREMAADLHRRAIVDLLRGKALGHHRPAQHDLRLPAGQVSGDDGACEAVAALRPRIGPDRSRLEEARRLHGDGPGSAGAGAPPVTGNWT